MTRLTKFFTLSVIIVRRIVTVFIFLLLIARRRASQSTTDATTTVPDATGKTGTFAAQMLKASGVNVAISGSASDRVVSQDIEVGSVVPYGTVVTLTTEPDGSSDAQQDADTPQDDAAQDDTPQDAAGENDQDSTTQDDTGSDAEQQ